MIPFVIITGLMFSDCGHCSVHATQPVTGPPQLENIRPLVTPSSNSVVQGQLIRQVPKHNNIGHSLWKREAVRKINKDFDNQTKPYVLKPIKIGGSQNDEKEGGISIVDEQDLVPDNNDQDDRKRHVVYDQFNNVFSEVVTRSEHSQKQRRKSRLNPGKLHRKVGSHEESSKKFLEDNTRSNKSTSEYSNESLEPETPEPSSSHSLLSYLPPSFAGRATENTDPEATSKNSHFANKERYRISSFVGTFGIARDDAAKSKPGPRGGHRDRGTKDTRDIDMGTDYNRNRRLRHDPEPSIGGPITKDKNTEISAYNNLENSKEEHLSRFQQAFNNNHEENTEVSNGINNSTENSERNAISGSSTKDVLSRSINLSGEGIPLGKSLQSPGYIKVYKVNGSHILGVRKIRPSKRARKLMFGKNKKIKPFPFSFAFPNKSISFPLRISTGKNNEIELSEVYGDNNFEDVYNDSFRRDQEQSGTKQYPRRINQSFPWGSTSATGDRISFYDDDANKVPTLAPPIYKPGRAEVKFAPTNEDLVRAGLLIPKEDKSELLEHPNDEHKPSHKTSIHKELLPPQEFYRKTTKNATEDEREKDDMSIFIESKHKMTYVLPPKHGDESYGEKKFSFEDDSAMSRDPSSTDSDKDINSEAERELSFTERPPYLIEHPSIKDRNRFTTSARSVSRKFDHPVYVPEPWHRHPLSPTTSLPTHKWTIYPTFVPPSRRSSFGKEEIDRYLDNDAAVQYHKAFYLEPVLRSIALPTEPSGYLRPTYSNWEEVASSLGHASAPDFREASSFGHASAPDFREASSLGHASAPDFREASSLGHASAPDFREANSLLENPNRETRYIFQQSSYSPVYRKFRNYKMSIVTPPTLFREHTESPLAEENIEDIAISDMYELHEHASHFAKKFVRPSGFSPTRFRHLTTLAPTVPAAAPSISSLTTTTTNENEGRDDVQAENDPKGLRNFYDIVYQSGELLGGRERQSATVEIPFESRDKFHSVETSLSSIQEHTTKHSVQEKDLTVTSPIEHSPGGTATNPHQEFPLTTPTTATTKRKSSYDRTFRKSGILRSYYSDVSTESETPKGSSSDRALLGQSLKEASSDQVKDEDYPRYAAVPHTSFSCDGLYRGYYADPKARCQVFHLCQQSGQKSSFLCPNGTLFSQRLLTCDHWRAVDCDRAEQHYHVNKDIFKEAPTSKAKTSLHAKIRFQDDDEKNNIIWHADESQQALTYRLHPNPSLVTLGSSMDSTSSSSPIPRYPGLEDLLREKEITKDSYHRRLKSKSKTKSQRKMPQPRTVKPHVVNPEMVEPYIFV